jgi:hypothetical protein
MYAHGREIFYAYHFNFPPVDYINSTIMDYSIRVITYGVTFLIGTALISGSIHWFRCNSATDTLKYPDGSLFGYYCTIISESQALETYEEIEREEEQNHFNSNDTVIPTTFLRLGK